MTSAFRIIIIGGSIAGLTLAHCLDQAGIDYIVLEKHQNIHPEVGGLIAVLPNGACILHQLGLHNALVAESESLNASHIGFPNGTSLRHEWPAHLEQTYVSAKLASFHYTLYRRFSIDMASRYRL